MILFVLRTGVQWSAIHRSLFPVSGSTAWRRLTEWQQAGVWEQLMDVLLALLQGAKRIDWSRACVDSGTVRPKGGGRETGPSPVDRGRPGSKHHLIVDRRGLLLAPLMLTSANPTLPATLDRMRGVRGRRGRPRRRPKRVHADKG